MYVPLSGLQQAVRLVDSLTELDDPAGFADLVLPGLARLISCDSVSFNEIGPERGQADVTVYPDGVASPVSLANFALFAHEHPLVQHYRATGDDRPARLSDLISQRRFHRLGLYAEVFRYVPVEYQIAFSLPSSAGPGSAGPGSADPGSADPGSADPDSADPDSAGSGSGGRLVGVAFNRAANDFSEDDRDLLTVLRCPLVTALQRARRRQRARDGLVAADSSMLDDLTDREIHVLRLAALGRTNTAIAHALDVSPRTVAKHLEHIYRKLDVTSRTSAVVTALASNA